MDLLLFVGIMSWLIAVGLLMAKEKAITGDTGAGSTALLLIPIVAFFGYIFINLP